MMMESETYPEEEPEDHQESENPADRMRRITAEPEDPEPETIIAPREDLEESTTPEDDLDAHLTIPSEEPDESVTLVAAVPDIPTLTSPAKPESMDEPEMPVDAEESEAAVPDLAPHVVSTPVTQVAAPDVPVFEESLDTTLAESETDEADSELLGEDAPSILPVDTPPVTVLADETEIPSEVDSIDVIEETSTKDLEAEHELETPAGLPGLTGAWFVQDGEEKESGADMAAEDELLEGDLAPDELSETFAEEDDSLVDVPEKETPIVKSDTMPSRPPESPLDSPEPLPALDDTPQRQSTPPPPMLGTRPLKTPPALGTQDMPLPRRVNEIDVDATQVSPAAYRRPAIERTIPPPAPPTDPPRRRAPIDWSRGASRATGCLMRMMILGLFAGVVIALGFGSFALYEYYQIAATLPSVDDLRQRASQFETTRILDRNGNVLYEILDPNAGRRTYVPLERISPFVVASTLATEDKAFYSNPGFDPLGIARAFWQNFQSGEVVSGASTITQQLVDLLVLFPEDRGQQSYMSKVREALTAVEITRRYTKDEILEIYLNEVNYGNLAYGVEAAAQTYFGTSADKLTLSQAAFLAGLPQAPSVYDVYSNRDVTMRRYQQVLVLMFEASQEQGCIPVSNNQQPVCVDEVAAATSYADLVEYEFQTPDVQIRYPHWVTYVRSILESQFDPQTIYRSGFTVFTTLDPGMQDAAEQIVADQIAGLVDRQATNGALVAIRPSTGEILAMVGSADFYDEDIDGQVNMAVAPRQPGSSIKPLTYSAAFEKGWTPGTLIWDVPSEFPPSGDPNDPRPPYQPVNYDGRFHGPVTVRSALANSYNVPAVKALDFIGVYNDPVTLQENGMIPYARRMGITTLTRPDYGLALTLGGGDVTLLEMTGAYAIYANGGRRIPPVAITRIQDNAGNVLFEYQPPPGEQVIRPEHAFMISSILSDNNARTPAFGPNSILNLPFTAAAKTGTTNDFRDNWTMGYTPDLAVGVWVGNADYSPMQNTSGLTGAAPIWANFMQVGVQYITGGNPSTFVKPAGVLERIICSVSGTEPSRWCPNQRAEYFAADQPPLPPEEDLWQRVLIDTWTGLRVSAACSDFTEEEFAINVQDAWARRWVRETSDGRAWAEQMGFSDPVFFVPNRDCTASDPRPILAFTAPSEGATITLNPLEIFGQADATADFRRFKLQYGQGEDPVKWETLLQGNNPFSQPQLMYSWDIEEFPEGRVTLRLRIESIHDTYAEIERLVRLELPTPTPTPTPTLTSTPTPTPTQTPTLTPTVTQTPTITPTSTVTTPPTITLTPIATPEPTSSATLTP